MLFCHVQKAFLLASIRCSILVSFSGLVANGITGGLQYSGLKSVPVLFNPLGILFWESIQQGILKLVHLVNVTQVFNVKFWTAQFVLCPPFLH